VASGPTCTLDVIECADAHNKLEVFDGLVVLRRARAAVPDEAELPGTGRRIHRWVSEGR